MGANLFRGDFSRFPPGWLSFPVGTLNGAIQEYHYLDLAYRGVPLGPWEHAICHLHAWVAGDEDGKSGLATISGRESYIGATYFDDADTAETLIEITACYHEFGSKLASSFLALGDLFGTC